MAQYEENTWSFLWIWELCSRFKDQRCFYGKFVSYVIWHLWQKDLATQSLTKNIKRLNILICHLATKLKCVLFYTCLYITRLLDEVRGYQDDPRITSNLTEDQSSRLFLFGDDWDSASCFTENPNAFKLISRRTPFTEVDFNITLEFRVQVNGSKVIGSGAPYASPWQDYVFTIGPVRWTVLRRSWK